ncbi:hypothetical protein KIL84_015742 [Mauremys mutica]|uniref:Uncharacterized protein n=1 Tax=Mauremys mutica TaxID=74926 RepID=A0A9D3WTN9_9SAUR|nr:hypothetical protein KIL84_015742 [Mauremys mutica]
MQAKGCDRDPQQCCVKRRNFARDTISPGSTTTDLGLCYRPATSTLSCMWKLHQHPIDQLDTLEAS